MHLQAQLMPPSLLGTCRIGMARGGGVCEHSRAVEVEGDMEPVGWFGGGGLPCLAEVNF